MTKKSSKKVDTSKSWQRTPRKKRTHQNHDKEYLEKKRPEQQTLSLLSYSLYRARVPPETQSKHVPSRNGHIAVSIITSLRRVVVQTSWTEASPIYRAMLQSKGNNSRYPNQILYKSVCVPTWTNTKNTDQTCTSFISIPRRREWSCTTDTFST